MTIITIHQVFIHVRDTIPIAAQLVDHIWNEKRLTRLENVCIDKGSIKSQYIQSIEASRKSLIILGAIQKYNRKVLKSDREHNRRADQLKKT